MRTDGLTHEMPSQLGGPQSIGKQILGKQGGHAAAVGAACGRSGPGGGLSLGARNDGWIGPRVHSHGDVTS